MNQRIAATHSRPLAGIPRPRSGFTLVELLVVIAIIAMLVGLLVPAVTRSREAARRATCMNNQKQIALAITNYATAKDKLPPGLNVQPMSFVVPPLMVGWVPQLLPYLEQNNLYQIYQANTWPTITKDASVAILICPSRNPTNSPAPLSYAVNAGCPDAAAPNPVNATTNLPADAQENGVFFDWYTPVVFDPKTPKVTTDLTFISRHDGTATTMLFSENLDTQDWVALPNVLSPHTPPIARVPNASSQCLTWWQGIIWYLPSYTSGAVYNPTSILNKNAGDVTYTSGAANSLNEITYGRPSSSHPGGFLATMCDGHTVFLSEDIEYRVYSFLLAPDTLNAKAPGVATAGAATLINYPGDWYNVVSNPTSGLKPLTETDITK